MFLPLIALATAVQAADLHVVVTAPGGDPVAIDYPDVAFGALPGFTVLQFGERELIVHITLSQLGDPPAGERPQILFDVACQSLYADKKGRAYLKPVSKPRIVTFPNVPASVTQGARIPIEGTDPVQYEDRALSIELLYVDPAWPDPDATPAEATESGDSDVDNPETPR